MAERDREAFALALAEAYVELRREVAQLPPAEQNAAMITKFGELEAALRVGTGLKEAEEEVRARVHELLRQNHGDEAVAWIQATARHYAENRRAPGKKKHGGS